MDFLDQLKQLASRIRSLKDSILTEEATKNAFILPFLQLLGYDVFNPTEIIPEFTADVGIKKGEKVDFAIVINGAPTILVEAKWCGEPLESHDSQLFRYFGTTTAKFAILTNGIVYRFYSDLEESNKMDLTPFMEFNFLDIQEALAPELKRFQKQNIDIDSLFNAASELKYTRAIKRLLAKQSEKPDSAFIAYVMSNVYEGRRTQQAVDKFYEIVKTSFNQYINDVLNARL